MASSWRSLLKEKIHSVLSRDKEIKEQFIGRQLTRDRLDQKVPHARCTIKDNEIKEQFLGRWLEIEPKVSQACLLTKACTIKRQWNKGAISWKMTRDRAESVTSRSIDQSLSSYWLRMYPIQKFLMTYLTKKKIEFYETHFSDENIQISHFGKFMTN